MSNNIEYRKYILKLILLYLKNIFLKSLSFSSGIFLTSLS